MSRTWVPRALVVATITAAVATAGALPAAAKAPEHPLTGYIGACNMVNNFHAMVHTAMEHAADQGKAGMWTGVAASGDPGCVVSFTP